MASTCRPRTRTPRDRRWRRPFRPRRNGTRLHHSGRAPGPQGVVADDLALPYWWLNKQASICISGKDDPGKRRVFDHSGYACRRHRHPTSSR
jgi:hypothetical protein